MRQILIQVQFVLYKKNITTFFITLLSEYDQK